MKLEQIKKNSKILGLHPDGHCVMQSVDQISPDSINVIFSLPDGGLKQQLLFRSDESRLQLVDTGLDIAFDAPPKEFKLGLEALRMHFAHLFDPMMAVHTSDVDPLPHQITAVYESLLPRQPLRFVLADDPGAGKTVMAGLYIKELLARADAQRIMVVALGSLVEQWQDEMRNKFGLDFTIFTKELDQTSRTGNAFNEHDLLLVRVDQLSRNEEYQEKVDAADDWDLVIVDEAHKLSASMNGEKIHKTLRYRLGEKIGMKTRHFLLMTATPHNGKDADFSLFMALLDSDRFYGKDRTGSHQPDVNDLMRRMVKEDLLTFEGKPLFPERKAYTLNYKLSNLESDLYSLVTNYVREEMNRADKLKDGRKGRVGFALTQLQRRLASSPEAIFQSISRRKKRLENRLEEEQILARGGSVGVLQDINDRDIRTEDDVWDMEEDLLDSDHDEWVESITDQSTAAQTIHELDAEIRTLSHLEGIAKDVVHSDLDSKWKRVSDLLQENPCMRDENGNYRKLIIFTEYTDTLRYLERKIGGLIGHPDAVQVIHGGVTRDERIRIQDEFRQNEDVLVLIGTDAMGEGVNLQNANLMINYDIPWNPNRLEQRFGRIHRIGQKEVCHLWNLIAGETMEGHVFRRLLEKLDVEREALGGMVFDILGQAIDEKSLRELLMEAIRYGEQEEVRTRMDQTIEGALDREHLRDLRARNALCEEHMAEDQLFAVKEQMEKAEARKLQPYFIRSFFEEAFDSLGGSYNPRESKRIEVSHVPARIIERGRMINENRHTVLKKYNRICFEKDTIRLKGKPTADLMHPGHPLMASMIDLMMETGRPLLQKGSVFKDPTDEGMAAKVLLIIDHQIHDGAEKDLSRRLQFVSINERGDISSEGFAPHLDYEYLAESELGLAKGLIQQDWVQNNLEERILSYAVENLVPSHYEEISERRTSWVNKTRKAVHERLIKEINYQQHRAAKLQIEVQAGKQPRVQPENARRKAEELNARLERRMRELDQMSVVTSGTPKIMATALVIPQGLLNKVMGYNAPSTDPFAKAVIEKKAMDAVFAIEQGLGHRTKDVSAEKCGWDITSYPQGPYGGIGLERHIEVKGRSKGQTTITISKNEILYGLNQKDKFLLAIVLVDGDNIEGPYYVPNPFEKEPDSGIASINYDLKELINRSVPVEATLKKENI